MSNIFNRYESNSESSWPEILADLRRLALDQWDFPPFAATGHYLEQLQRFILTKWEPGDLMPWVETLPYGIFLGDVMAQRFGAEWKFTELTPPTLTPEQVLNLEISLAHDGGRFRGRPMYRIGKFVQEPDKSLTSWFDGFEAVAEGRINFDHISAGQVCDTSPESHFVIKGISSHPDWD